MLKSQVNWENQMFTLVPKGAMPFQYNVIIA